MRQRSSSNRDIKLPHWIFDVDSDDEYDENSGLLEELDIDIIHIYRNIGWMLTAPWYYIFRRQMDSIHPLQSSHNAAPSLPSSPSSSSSSAAATHKNHIDFW